MYTPEQIRAAGQAAEIDSIDVEHLINILGREIMKTDNSFEVSQDDPVFKMSEKLPFVIDWCEYKGETVVAQINYERSLKANRPMMDISYCMTKALNYVIMYTRQWDKNKFKPSKLGVNF